MILSGEKKTEYRELKLYWIERLWTINVHNLLPQKLLQLLVEYGVSPYNYGKQVNYTHIQFYNGGYFSDSLPNFTIELNRIGYGPGKESWGAVPGETYFSLYLGNVISRSNC